MKKILTGALAALTLGGVVLGGASTASARDWDDHHGNGGAAIAAGIAGLAIGAALASSDHHYYAPAPAYYGPDYYGPGYYGSGYVESPAYYGYERHCWVQTRWNYRWGGYERVRICR